MLVQKSSGSEAVRGLGARAMRWLPLCLAVGLSSAVAASASAQDFNVTAPTFAYTINGAVNPPLTLERGRTYRFAINVASNHPFYIQSQSGGTWSDYNSGVTGNGITNGTLTFAVPSNAPNQLRYICGFHASMTNTITVTSPALKSPGQSCGASSECQSGLFCTNNVCCYASSCSGNACLTGTCGSNGQCTPRANGTSCNDNNACTRTDTCQSGVCQGGNPVTCTASSQCHSAGTCNPSTGTCSNPTRPNGTSCNDGNACTVSDVCQSGTCSGSPMICNAPPTCQGNGTCSAGSCVYQYEPAGAACSSDPNLVGQTCDTNHQCSGGTIDQGGLSLWGSNSGGQIGTGSTSTKVTSPRLLTASGMDDLISVAAGADHVLVLDVHGTAWGFGRNNWGALGGTGSQSPVLAPVRVFDGAVGVAAGNGHSAILDANYDVRTYGILGSTRLDLGGVAALSIAAGGRHGVVLAADGKVWTWGANGSGQLGNGTWNNSHTTAVQVTLPRPARAVAAGADFSLALLADGTVYAWGSNYSRELAQPESVYASNVPLRVTGLQNVRAIAASGWHAMALLANGTVRAWGDNSFGALGNGVVGGMESTPVTVAGLNRVQAIAPMFFSSAALRADGTVWTWGYNANGELGDPAVTSESVASPRKVPSLANIVAIAGGSHFMAAMRATSTVKSFGSNSNGQLGAGRTPAQLASSNVPFALATRVTTPPSPLPPFKAISSGSSMHRLALGADGSVWTFGANSRGELGNSGADSEYPVKVQGISDAIAVAAGDYDSFALRADGTLWVWGGNGVGNHGNGTTSTAAFPTPARVTALSNVIGLAARNNTLAIRADGAVYAWGWNRYYQCGTTSTTGSITTPIRLTLPAASPYARSVASGTYNSYVLLANGTIASYGRNDAGQLGTGATGSASATARIVTNTTGVSAISAGFSFALALQKGRLLGFGANSHGQLGTASSPVTTPVMLAPYVRAFSAGQRASYFVMYYGRAFAVGSNSEGALGTGSTAASSNAFGQMSSAGSGVLDVAGGYSGGELLFQ
jgi:alpha-tubulin suppressor-like RCC1 family protein